MSKDRIREPIIYILCRPLIKLYIVLILRIKFIGKDNIPKKGKIILAGTHTSKLDPFILMSATKRVIHFFAKKELWEMPKGLIFSRLGLIKVDRQTHTTDSLGEGKKYLDNDKVVLIFPEGTIEKEIGKSLPYKIGVVKLAYDTNTKIVPFAISNKTVRFGEAMEIKSNDLDKELDRLKEKVEDLRK